MNSLEGLFIVAALGMIGLIFPGRNSNIGMPLPTCRAAPIGHFQGMIRCGKQL